MPKGTIKKIIDDRHFGFIKTENGQEIFFHGTALTNISWDDLNTDMEVEFEIESTPKGDRAVNVTASNR